jgi:hypothetical protein
VYVAATYTSSPETATHPRDMLLLIDIAQEFGPAFFVFLACDLPRGISPLQKLQRRLHLPVGNSPHRYHEGKEQNPEDKPEDPPIRVHSPVVVHRHHLNMFPISSRRARLGYPMMDLPTLR